MKRRLLFAGITLMFSVAAFGQGTASVNGSSDVVLDSGTKISGQLQSALDVKKAKVGDEVVLKTANAIKQNGKTVVPKGSKLIGRVTEVQQKAKSNGMSRLGMVFDRIEGKNLSAPINASIVSIANVAGSATVADTTQADVFGSSSSSARTSSSGGGGLVGGVTNTAGGVLDTTTRTVGGITQTATNTVGATAGTVTRTVSGIQLSNSADASANSGTTLSSSNKNIRLEKGTTVHVRLNSSASATK